MSNTTPRTVHLKAMLALEEKRAALQQQIDEIHHQISIVHDQIFAKRPTTVISAKSAPKAVSKGRAKRGALKAKIMAALEAAGNNSVGVPELGSALVAKGAKPDAWLHDTAKRNPRIVKIAVGHYSLKG